MKTQHNIAFTLVSGNWRKLFSVFEYKVIVAKALTYCVHHKNPPVEIKGYLITTTKTYLVLDIKPNDLNIFLYNLSAFVKAEIEVLLYNYTKPLNENSINAFGQENKTEIFTKTDFNNFYLKDVLCNVKNELPYYNPFLEKIKHWANQHDFCSCIDYSGAVGPVVLKPTK